MFLLESGTFLRGQVRQQWAKLTDDDVARSSGKRRRTCRGVTTAFHGYGKRKRKMKLQIGFKKMIDTLRNKIGQISTLVLFLRRGRRFTTDLI